MKRTVYWKDIVSSFHEIKGALSIVLTLWMLGRFTLVGPKGYTTQYDPNSQPLYEPTKNDGPGSFGRPRAR